MNRKPSHVIRAPDAAGRKVCSGRKRPATPAVCYPPGFFTALVVQHDWPPRFVARYAAGRNSVAQADAARVNRAAGVGHGAIDLGLPGAVEHIQRWRLESAVKS